MSGGYTKQDYEDELMDMDTALEMEQTCVTFYQESAEQVDDSRAKELYQWFAGTKRIAELERVRAATNEASAWAPEVAEEVKAADEPFDGAPTFDTDAGGKPGKVEIITLRQGAELEKKAASIYHTAVQRSRDKSVRELWRYLAATEEAHIKLVGSYFDGLMALAIKKK